MTKLIPLEEALNIMGTISNASQSLDKMRELRNIPTIDPIAIIDKMIDELGFTWDDITAKGKLRELKSRLSTNL